MRTGRRASTKVLCALLLLGAGQVAKAQITETRSRVVQEVNDTVIIRTQGNIHPLARAEFDRGAVADSQPMTRMLLLLQRSTEQETALRQLMDAQLTKGSANFHNWLTPAQFGAQFGPSDRDIRAVTDWLTRQGLQIAKVSDGRTTIEFSGNVGQVRNAFQTEIHKFAVSGHEYFANINEPAIPAALAPVLQGVVALHNFPKHSHMHSVGTFQRDLATGQVKPLFTYTDSQGTFYGVGPADFAKIYNIPAGADGSGQSIAVVGQSNINLQDVRDFRTMFGLPANDPQIIVNGPDPGILGPGSSNCQGPAGDEGEADLDVEWAGAVAPAATIKLVVSQTTCSNPTQVTGGVDLSALYIVDNNIAPVMSESYGNCEFSLGTTGNAFYNALWQQAASEGITVAVSAGDNGPAGCDPDTIIDPNAATQGLAVSGLASTPYNVAIGGTDFDQSSNLTNYWSSTNAATTQLSALGYIAEVPWSDSTCAANYPTACTTVDSTGADISAASGGPSNCAISNGSTCSQGYPKPAFQTGVTPADSERDIPDISLFASNGFNSSFYIVCQSDMNPNNAPCDLSTSATSGTHNFTGAGGTSGGTPTFAAIMALVNQKTGQRQGNANFTLYALAAKETYANCNSSSFNNPATPAPASCVFYDITKGNNGVACDGGTTNCSNKSSGFGVLVSGVGADHGNPAFQAVAGYDLATGLGSINVANLLSLWSSASRAATTTTLSGASSTAITSGTSFSVKVSVSSGAGTPTGDVSLTALESDQATILGSVGPFTLSSGSITANSNLLPPGTVYIQGYYAGDATHAASSSLPLAVQVSGANQSSKTVLSWVSFDANNNPILSTSSQSVTYGSSYILQVAVTNSGGTVCTNNGTGTAPGTPCPTGAVTLTDKGNPLNDFLSGTTPTNLSKLNNQGIAEDQPIQLSVGSHSIMAAYAGDPNFGASTSNTLAVTISQASTTTNVASSLSSVTSGTSVTISVLVSTTSNGAGPTGSISFTNGSTSIGTATCAPTSGMSNSKGLNGTTAGTAFCLATFPTTISALYPPPQKEPRTPIIPFVLLALGLVSFLALVRSMPEPRRRSYAYAGLLAFALLATVIAGCGGGGGSSGGGGGSKTVTIKAAYPGDANYTASSNSVNISVQ